MITWGRCRGASSWNRPPLPCDAVWTAACATPSSLTWRDAPSALMDNLYWINCFPRVCDCFTFIHIHDSHIGQSEYDQISPEQRIQGNTKGAKHAKDKSFVSPKGDTYPASEQCAHLAHITDMHVWILNCVFTHHLNVVKDSRHLLNPFHHFFRVLGILGLPGHLLIQRHLPAHSRVLHLKYIGQMLSCTLYSFLGYSKLLKRHLHLALQMQIVLQELPHFLICVFL